MIKLSNSSYWLAFLNTKKYFSGWILSHSWEVLPSNLLFSLDLHGFSPGTSASSIFQKHMLGLLKCDQESLEYITQLSRNTNEYKWNMNAKWMDYYFLICQLIFFLIAFMKRKGYFSGWILFLTVIHLVCVSTSGSQFGEGFESPLHTAYVAMEDIFCAATLKLELTETERLCTKVLTVIYAMIWYDRWCNMLLSATYVELYKLGETPALLRHYDFRRTYCMLFLLTRIYIVPSNVLIVYLFESNKGQNY